MECWTSILILKFGTVGTAQSSAPRADRIAPRKKIPWHSFLLKAEMALGLVNTTICSMLFADDQLLIAQDYEDLEYMTRKLIDEYELWG